MGPIIIQTERLNLRGWTADDVPALVELLSHPDVNRFIMHGRSITSVEADAFVVRYERLQRERGWCRWFVELAEEPGRLAGFCGVGCTFAPELELGWTLRRDLWGRGLATEAARGAIDYLFSTVGLPEICSAIDPDNERSRNVALRLGMREEGTLTYLGQTSARYVIENPGPPATIDPRFALDCEGESPGSALAPDNDD